MPCSGPGFGVQRDLQGRDRLFQVVNERGQQPQAKFDLLYDSYVPPERGALN